MKKLLFVCLVLSAFGANIVSAAAEGGYMFDYTKYQGREIDKAELDQYPRLASFLAGRSVSVDELRNMLIEEANQFAGLGGAREQGMISYAGMKRELKQIAGDVDRFVKNGNGLNEQEKQKLKTAALYVRKILAE